MRTVAAGPAGGLNLFPNSGGVVVMAEPLASRCFRPHLHAMPHRPHRPRYLCGRRRYALDGGRTSANRSVIERVFDGYAGHTTRSHRHHGCVLIPSSPDICYIEFVVSLCFARLFDRANQVFFLFVSTHNFDTFHRFLFGMVRLSRIDFR